MRQPGDALNALWQALAREPWRHDFYMTLRRIECLHPDRPRLGTAVRPKHEPIRLGQTPAMDFAPAAISAFTPASADRPPQLDVRFFGLFGPNGPLPLHLTDHVRERLLARDPSLAQFADVFHHRLLLLFYRAWAQAQPTVSMDRPAQDRFAACVGSLIGYGAPGLQRREALPDHLRLHFAGLYAGRTRHGDGLAAILAAYFRQTVTIVPFVGHWMELPDSERTRLARHPGPGQQLGRGVVLGRRVWDRQHKFRIEIGPLDLPRYEAFLPGASALPTLLAVVRDYLCHQLEWELRLLLCDDQVPRLRLGRDRSERPSFPADRGWRSRLGWTSWLGVHRRAAGQATLTLLPERPARRPSGTGAPASRPGSASCHA
jgi:type VI secretion system protein ImpH